MDLRIWEDTGSLAIEELNHAERKLLMMIQSEESQDKFRFKHPKTIRDDNGLIRMETKILRRDDLKLFICPILLPKEQIDLKFILPRSPWWEVFWERMLGTMKKATMKKKLMGKIPASRRRKLLRELAEP
ncbi:unnamed protein product [Orchesella dallaii]|uniref:Uncharacterized protein n=1 Tax=Orchesella dallaii TaxID=48710 RepID=A0ABP1Q3P7_9HEXA